MATLLGFLFNFEICSFNSSGQMNKGRLFTLVVASGGGDGGLGTVWHPVLQPLLANVDTGTMGVDGLTVYRDGCGGGGGGGGGEGTTGRLTMDTVARDMNDACELTVNLGGGGGGEGMVGRLTLATVAGGTNGVCELPGIWCTVIVPRSLSSYF